MDSTSSTFLAIETSTPRGSIAVVTDGGDVVFSASFESDRSHNSLLFGPLAEALQSVGSLAAIIVGIGPGSYTGVRIGISAAIGVALAKGIKVAGVSSLCALQDAPESGDFDVIGDARRGSFFHANVRNWQLNAEPELCSGDELSSRISGDVSVLTCDAPEKLPVPATLSAPDAIRLAVAARRQASLNFDDPVEPIYLRAPYVTTPKPKGRPALG